MLLWQGLSQVDILLLYCIITLLIASLSSNCISNVAVANCIELRTSKGKSQEWVNLAQGFYSGMGLSLPSNV